MRFSLTEMGYRQLPTLYVKDSVTGDVFVKKNIHQRSSRAINMRFYWVRYRVIQGNFLFCWVAVEQNPADYFTNHHPTNHNCSKQSTHILPTADASKYSLYMAPNDLTGCVEYLPA